MKITYRPAREKDIPKLADLMKSFYRTEKVPFSRPQSIRAMRDLVARPVLGSLVIIEADLEIIGYYCLTFGFSLESHGDVCLLDEIYITPSFQHQGIGSRTIKTIASDLKRSGYKALHLTVNGYNTAAVGFYKKNGFSPTKASLMTRLLASSGTGPAK